MNQRIAPIQRPPADDVGTVVAGSRLLRTIDRLCGLFTAAWLDSALKKHVDLSWNAQDTVDRVRAGGWVAVSAVAAHFFLIGVPGMMASPAPALGWCAAGVLGLACILRPRAVVTAWRESAVRRRLDAWLRPAR